MQFNPVQSSSFSNLPQERLIARYVHSGNSTIQASSVNLSTGVFTTTQPMSWTSGNIYKDVIVSYTNGIPNKLFSEWNGSNAYGLQVIDANTFYIVSGNTANAIVTYGSTESVNLSQLQFEYNIVGPPLIDLTKVTVGDQLRTTWAGVRNRPGWTTVSVNWSYSGGTGSWYGDIIDGRTFEIGYYEQNFKYIREMGMLYTYGGKSISQQWNGGTSWSLSSGIDPERGFSSAPNLQFTSVNVGGGIANGTEICVYSTY